MIPVGACATYSPVPVSPRPSEALLQDCPAPKLVPDPDKASDTDLQLEKLEIAKYAVCERGMFQRLVAWVRGTLMK